MRWDKKLSKWSKMAKILLSKYMDGTCRVSIVPDVQLSQKAAPSSVPKAKFCKSGLFGLYVAF